MYCKKKCYNVLQKMCCKNRAQTQIHIWFWPKAAAGYFHFVVYVYLVAFFLSLERLHTFSLNHPGDPFFATQGLKTTAIQHAGIIFSILAQLPNSQFANIWKSERHWKWPNNNRIICIYNQIKDSNIFPYVSPKNIKKQNDQIVKNVQVQMFSTQLKIDR